MEPEDVHITNVTKRGPVYFVTGMFKRDGRWHEAAFTAHAPDVEAQSRDAFETFCRQMLPACPKVHDWERERHQAIEGMATML